MPHKIAGNSREHAMETIQQIYLTRSNISTGSAGRAKGISHMQICINFDLFAGLLGSILGEKFGKQNGHDKLQMLTDARGNFMG